MAETEVESILREIRERVITQQRSGQRTSTSDRRHKRAIAAQPQRTVASIVNRTTTAENLA